MTLTLCQTPFGPEYHRPQDLATALDLLARPEVRTVPLAGGTALLGRRGGTLAVHRSVEAVVDLQDLGLAFIQQRDNTVRIGAMTTLQQMAGSSLLREVADGLLARTAHRSASSILRHQATLGGTLIAAAGSSDLPPALLVLGAEVVLRTPDERRLSLADFYAQGGAVKGGLLTEVRVPWPAEGTRTAFHRVGRTPADSAIVCVAAALTVVDGVCQEVRLAVGGIGPLPVQLTEVAAAFGSGVHCQGQALAEVQGSKLHCFDEVARAARASVNPVADFRASAEYRQEMVGVLTRRALQECCGVDPEVGKWM